ncbi:protein Smaug homolog 1 [Periophthalmus magnuspinnatus]|uniref:protein Smaug homolog 1 n=1 Tax=Periophthalmus magnuspinnatus TaxID=409849 RepID=UPI00145B8FA0|nr:protein Smaug homolog 1 [Periophthalmus magnuspinnatus]
MMFRDQVSVLAGWFKGWNECEQTVALLSLLKRVSRTQARFLQLCLEHSLSECSELIAAETDANDPVVISQWHSESKERAISLVLSHLPLLKPGNSQAKGEYMRLLPWILAQTIESGRHVEESRQLLSYALIHPATSIEDRSALALWLTHLEEHAGRGDSLERSPHNQSSGGGQKSQPYPHTQSSGGGPKSQPYPQTQGSGGGQKSQPYPQTQSSGGGQKSQPYPRYGSEDRLNGWQQQGMQWSSENGHLFPSSSVPAAINAVGTGPAGALSPAPQHSPLKRSVSLTPPICSSQPTGGALGQVWLSQEDLRRPPEHVPLSPQSSVASSGSGGSEPLDDLGLGLTRGSFHEEGSGMRDVPQWLKSLRLHKYAALFSSLTYDQMLNLSEEQLEAQKVTKGARHKIVISIQKLKERQSQLRSLEKEVLEGAILRGPLQELHQMILTPIRPFTCDTSPAPGAHLSHLSGGGASGGEGESGSSSIAEGDLPAQFTRVMGKVCTQLLVSRADEENLSLYLQLLDKCLLHEAFTETQKKRLVSWKQQVQKLFRSIPRKTLLDLSAYRRSARGFGQSNSLPSGSLGAGPSVRRGLRQYQMPSRSLPGARLGLLPSTGALLGATARSSTPTGRQGLWFANPGGSNSVPSRSHSSVTRTRSLPVPQSMHLLQHPDLQQTPMEPDINNRLESLCLSMTEHALGDGADRTSTI